MPALPPVNHAPHHQAGSPRYRPDPLRCLLVAEALPDSLDRFFYYPDGRRADYLFLGVMQVLYPGLKEEFVASSRPSAQKEALLQRFQADGFYLLDALRVPPRLYHKHLHRAVPELLSRIDAIAEPTTPIILIKATTYEAAYQPLRNAGYSRVFAESIPFPGQGWQHHFCAKFAKALQTLGITWSKV